MTVFTEHWFLDAVAPGRWVEITGKEGSASVRFVLVTRKLPFGRISLGHAPLLPRLGPDYEGIDERSTPETRLSLEHRLLQSVIKQLPPHDDFIVSFHWHNTNAMAFHWAGFDLGLLYTYALRDLSDLDAVWQSFTSRARNAIRKAERHVHVTDGDPAELYRLLLLTYNNQGRAARYPLALLERLVSALHSRGQGKILIAKDTQGAAHAALLVIWDSVCGYYLAAGSDPALRSSGAMSLLMREAIRITSGHAQQFDFEGSMHAGIEGFLRSFGAEQVPYVQVTRASRVGRLMRMGARLGGLRGATVRIGDKSL